MITARWGALLVFSACTSEPPPEMVAASPSVAAEVGTASGEERYFFGETEIPGLNPSACEGPLPEQAFALNSDTTTPFVGPYVVLTGTLPMDIQGSAVSSVTVNGSARGVRKDAQRNVWTYFLAGESSDYEVVVTAASGLTRSLRVPLTVEDSPVPARDIEYHHSIGTWMYSWFRGEEDWNCKSPWRPLGGFASWDGSVSWARQQLLDQVDAHLDVVGLHLDSQAATGATGYHFGNVVNVLQAARELLDEGLFPPRLFPFLDTAGISARRVQGAALDLAVETDRAEFYAHATAFYQAAQSTFGERHFRTAVAHFDGKPAVAVGKAGTALNADEPAIADFKARFLAERGVECFFIAHPESWPAAALVDELTPMLGGSAYYLEFAGPGSVPAITLTPGYWDPVSDPFYLAREGGAPYQAAWQRAVAERDVAHHLWISSWNETTSGSGIFAADPVNGVANDAAKCGSIANPHVDDWGPDSRYYIETTREQARAWSNEHDLDAMPVTSDLPARMHPGERRYVTVAMRNTGDAPWTPEHHKLGITFSAAAREFRLDDLGAMQSDELVERFGGIVRGMTGVFTVLLTAPCEPGAHLVAFEIYDSQQGGFGSQLQQIVTVE